MIYIKTETSYNGRKHHIIDLLTGTDFTKVVSRILLQRHFDQIGSGPAIFVDDASEDGR